MASPSLWVLGALLSPVDPFRTVWSEAQATLPASFPLPPRAPETCEDAKEPGGIAILLAETVSPPPLPLCTQGPQLCRDKVWKRQKEDPGSGDL